MTATRPDYQPLVPPGEINHHLADLTATFAADVSLAAAQAKLREHDQWLPIDGDPNQTLGTLVERNSTGPLRLGHGAWRDLLLGAQFRNGQGELITVGGRTLKNVAGYDLTKFMVGQFGVFGSLVTITTRTYKAPEAALLAVFNPDVQKLHSLLVTPCRPHWAVLTNDALLCGFFGDQLTAEYYERQVPRYGSKALVRQSLDQDIAHRASLWRAKAEAPINFRASVPPASWPAIVKALDGIDWVADPAFGITIGSCSDEQKAAFRQACQRVGGSVMFVDSNGRPLDLAVDDSVRGVLERLKNAFDPENRLSPLPTKTT